MKYLNTILIFVILILFLVFFDTYTISLYKDTAAGDLLVKKNKKTGSVQVLFLQATERGWINFNKFYKD